jgi:homopolymeric O-antigen transport system permease protein
VSTVADRKDAIPETAAPAAAPAHAGKPVRVIEPWRKGVRHRIGEARRQRGMFWYYGRSFVKRRYRNTWLGWIWLPLRPAIDTVSKAFVFGGLMSQPYYGKPSIVFMALGNAGWLLFQRSSYWGGRSMRMSRSFVRNAHPPWLPKLLAIVVPTLVDFVFSIAIAVIALAYYYFVRGQFYLVPNHGLLIGLTGYVMLTIMGMSLGWCMAPFTQFTRDIRYLFAYVMMFWYYVSPIVWTPDSIPHKYQVIAKYNPVTAPLQLVSHGFLGSDVPGPTSVTLTISVVFTLCLASLGLWMINRFERAAVGRL